MSTSYRTYIGPYVRCVVGMVEVMRQWDVIEEIGEQLTPAFGNAYHEWVGEHRAHIWVANVATLGRDYHLNNRVDFSLTEITPDMVRQEMALFEAQFAPALAVFRSRYGAGAVSLHWGIVRDYS